MKMKKFGKALTTTLALSMVLASCSSETTGTSDSGSTATSGGSSSSSSEKITLQLWHYYNANTKDNFDFLIQEFNDTVGAEHSVEVEAYSYSSVSDLAAALVSAAKKEVGMMDLPHIFAAYTDTALLLDNLGEVASVEDYFTAEELALFQQDFLNEGRFDQDGNLKMIPVAKSTELMFLNETDFADFAEDTGVALEEMGTWEGLADVAESYYHWTDALTPEENDGLALFGLDSEANFMLVAAKQLGEEVYLYEGDTVSFGLSETAAQRIWDCLFVPYIHGYYAGYGDYRSDDVKSGDLLLYVGSTSSVYYFPTQVQLGRDNGYDITGVAMPYPTFEGEEPVVVQQGAGMVMSKSTAEEEEAAALFLKWFTDVENNLEFAVSTGYIPVENEAMSLSGVMGVLEESGDISKVVESCIEVTYEVMMPNYEFYSSRPFDGSYNTRNALGDSVIAAIDRGLEERDTLMAEGMSREEAVEIATGEAAFEAWYQGLSEEITGILSQ